MSLFGKFKENITHGGIKVQLQAPASISMNDPTVPISVEVTASEEQHTIENVQVRITARSYNQSFSQSSNTSTTQGQSHTVAEANYAQPFVVMPNETKSVQLSIVMNQGGAIEAQLPEGSGMAQVAGMLQKLQTVSEAMNGDSYQYFIEASAKIEGVTLGPSHEQPIQVLKPGQMGGGFNMNVHL